jgi:hypothetical protein
VYDLAYKYCPLLCLFASLFPILGRRCIFSKEENAHVMGGVRVGGVLWSGEWDLRVVEIELCDADNDDDGRNHHWWLGTWND